MIESGWSRVVLSGVPDGCGPLEEADHRARVLLMKNFSVVLAAVGMSVLGAHGAVVTYELGGTGVDGTVASGTFSFDTTVIGAGYDNFSALSDLISFSVTLSSIAGGSASTTFTKGVDTSSFFVASMDGFGAFTDFNPGFDENADGYTLNPFSENQATLEHSGLGVSEAITWNYTQVPEVGPTALGAGLGLLGFMGVRAWRRRG